MYTIESVAKLILFNLKIEPTKLNVGKTACEIRHYQQEQLRLIRNIFETSLSHSEITDRLAELEKKTNLCNNEEE